MNKNLCLAMIILLIIPVSYASSDKEIFDDWVETGDEKEIDGKLYSFIVSERYRNVVFRFADTTITVENGSCDYYENTKFCVKEMDFSSVDPITDIIYYKADVEISVQVADLSLTKEVDDTSLIVSEKTNVKIIIKNDGSAKADNIILTDTIENFTISNIDGCTIEKNQITWTGSLSQDGEKKCKYTIKAISPISYKSISKISYFNDYENKTKDIITKIKVEEPALNIKLSSDKNETGINKDVQIDINLTNKEDYDLTSINFELTIPSALSIKEYKPLKRSGNKLSWSGMLEEDKSRTFTVSLKSIKSGDHKITADARFYVNRILSTTKKEAEITVNVDRLDILTNIEELEKDKPDNAFLQIKNPSSKYGFNEIAITTKSNIPELTMTKTFPEIGIKRFIDVFSIPITPKENIDLDINMTYKTINNEQLTLKKDLSLEFKTIEKKTVEQQPVEKEIIETQEVTQEPETEQEPKQEIETEKEQKSIRTILTEEKSYLFLMGVILIIIIVFALDQIIKIFKRPKRPEDIFID